MLAALGCGAHGPGLCPPDAWLPVGHSWSGMRHWSMGPRRMPRRNRKMIGAHMLGLGVHRNVILLIWSSTFLGLGSSVLSPEALCCSCIWIW